jgi:hypothetical protein
VDNSNSLNPPYYLPPSSRGYTRTQDATQKDRQQDPGPPPAFPEPYAEAQERTRDNGNDITPASPRRTRQRALRRPRNPTVAREQRSVRRPGPRRGVEDSVAANGVVEPTLQEPQADRPSKRPRRSVGECLTKRSQEGASAKGWPGSRQSTREYDKRSSATGQGSRGWYEP